MDRNRAHTLSVPDDWREVLAPFAPALRANLGHLPDPDDCLVAIDMEAFVCEYRVIDSANHVMHSYEFDHIPTPREAACCHMAVCAPHN